jgi:2,3-dihydroxyphenylpropionate 1,2-dioxygenase
MNTMLVCASHSPLMLVGMPPSAPDSQAFFSHIDATKKRVEAFDPQLVVVFGPDHFNGFFFDLMPSFCIGAAAETTEDWGLPKLTLDVPQDIALGCIDSVRERDIDVALSWNMRADHGLSIALGQFGGRADRYPVLPIFINCAAAPRPSFRRSRLFGAAVGRYLGSLDKRVLIVASGGVSHDPPTPRFEGAPLPLRQRLVDRHIASHAELQQRESRVIAAATNLVKGEGPCLPPNESWDRAFMQKLIAGDTAALDAISDAEIDREAGFGGHEVRTWVAAFAAMHETGRFEARLDYYRVVPEWITGMGLITGERA